METSDDLLTELPDAAEFGGCGRRVTGPVPVMA
jgi:hypothetical protein